MAITLVASLMVVLFLSGGATRWTCTCSTSSTSGACDENNQQDPQKGYKCDEHGDGFHVFNNSNSDKACPKNTLGKNECTREECCLATCALVEAAEGCGEGNSVLDKTKTCSSIPCDTDTDYTECCVASKGSHLVGTEGVVLLLAVA